jgi:hypothetical protein
MTRSIQSAVFFSLVTFFSFACGKRKESNVKVSTVLKRRHFANIKADEAIPPTYCLVLVKV